MNFNIDIDGELWEAIEKNYKHENYSSAILDAMLVLTDTIRNKTGLEGDGASLVGQAFNIDNPKIQLNKLQTDSERNVQKGIQEILRGFYTAIRNPRSHDKIEDKKEEADAIISFIDYLLKMIDKSKLSFEEDVFLKCVFDEHFVSNFEYADLLVQDIPKRQRANIAITVILQREKGNIDNLHYFISAIFNSLDEVEIDRVTKVISDELKLIKDEDDIEDLLWIFPSKYWNRINKTVKMRIENLLLKSLIDGRYDIENEECESGHLATLINVEHMLNFSNKDEWNYNIVKKLQSDDIEEKNYLKEYFWEIIFITNHDKINEYLEWYINNGLEIKDEYVIEMIKSDIIYEKDHPWWEVFKEQLEHYPEIKYTEFPF